MDASAAASTSASAIKPDDSAASRLKALQDQIAARKRKRASEAAAEDVKGKGRAVSFAVAEEGPSGPATTNGTLADPSSSILKPSRMSQEDAYTHSKASVPKAPAKAKTTAKKRYLKNKLERRKARKRAAAGDAASTQDGEEDNEKEVAEETPEERQARKRAKRDERNALRAAAASAGNESVNQINVEEQATGAISASTLAEEQADHARRAERKARKQAKRAAVNPDGDTSMAGVDDSLPTRKEQKQEAIIASMKAAQEKANKKALKAAQKAKYRAEALGDQDAPMDDTAVLPPTQPDALPRFPGPEQPRPPSQRELDELAISSELKDAIIVDQAKSVSIQEYQSEEGPGKLSEAGVARLQEMGIKDLFAVQKAVLPILLQQRALYLPLDPPRDICVSAPTGSGKTLGYVVPIVETLSARIVIRLRTLVVLPTRDLVMQVRDVFEHFARGTGLKVGTATGQHSFAHEQAALVGDMPETGHQPQLGGTSKVDILICTPGRLMDHLKATKGFSLQHLRFLVIDEADRLLNQSFNDWLKTILSHVELNVANAIEIDGEDDAEDGSIAQSDDAVAPALLHRVRRLSQTDLDVTLGPSTQKLLFSATLTRDPARVSALHLHDPIYIAVTDSRTADVETAASHLLDAERQFVLPATLKEQMYVVPGHAKPLVLLHLLYTLSLRRVLCFTKSVEASNRLVQLLSFFADEHASGHKARVEAANYSSDLSPAKRREVVERFVKGDVGVLVCSDLVARGIDIPSVEHVINYDAPIDMRKYVHRVGRTARAGKEGQAWSLVETQEANAFKHMLKEAGRYEAVRKLKIKEAETEPFNEAYEAALGSLRDVYTRD